MLRFEEIQGVPSLLIPIAKAKGELSRKLLQGEKEYGSIVRGEDTSYEDWNWGGVIEFEENYYGYGPVFSGTPLIEALDQVRSWQDSAQIIDFFIQLALSFQVLFKKGKLTDFVEVDMILIDMDTWDMLLLPRDLRNQVYTMKSNEARDKTLVHWSSPNGTDEERLIIEEAAFLSYVLTGVIPFASEIVREDNCTPVHLNLYNEKITLAVSETVMTILKGKSEYLFHNKWINLLESWRTTLFSENQTLPIKKLKHWEESQVNRVQRHRFFRHHGLKVGLIIGGVTLLVALLWGPVKQALEPPITTNFSPEQVVETLYSSVSSLDTMAMSDLFAKGFKSGYENESIFLYVSSKQTEAYEQNPSIIDVNRWIEAGQPQLPDVTRVFGMTDVTTEIIHETSEEVVVESTYIRWELDQVDVKEETSITEIRRPSSIAFYQEELVTLVPYEKHNTWVIKDHTITKREPLNLRYPEDFVIDSIEE